MSTKEKDVLVSDLRSTLKDLFAKELEQLPAYLGGLEPKEKLDYLLKLMPFIMPKVNSIEHDTDEPASW